MTPAHIIAQKYREQKPDVWDYWKREERSEEETIWFREELEGDIWDLHEVLSKDDHDKLYDWDYVEIHFGNEESEHCIIHCESRDAVKNKIIEHFS